MAADEHAVAAGMNAREMVMRHLGSGGDVAIAPDGTITLHGQSHSSSLDLQSRANATATPATARPQWLDSDAAWQHFRRADGASSDDDEPEAAPYGTGGSCPGSCGAGETCEYSEPR